METAGIIVRLFPGVATEAAEPFLVLGGSSGCSNIKDTIGKLGFGSDQEWQLLADLAEKVCDCRFSRGQLT